LTKPVSLGAYCLEPRWSAKRTQATTRQRVVGFDNERGKGDHMHVAGKEAPYVFTTVDRLVEDFIAAVEAARRSKR
jgi:hypothetical protein